MEKIQREVKTYKNVYVSVDGKEFNNEADCRAWENSYSGTLEASWKLIKKVEASSCGLGLPWSNEDAECYVIEPKNMDEIVLINAYVQDVTHNNCHKLTTNHIGKMVALNFGYDRDYCDMYMLSDHIKDITNYISKLENEIHETETQQND